MAPISIRLRALVLSAVAGIATWSGAAPTITQQPQLTVTANSGQSAAFSVQATGTGTLRWQWRRMGGDLVGQTAPSLTLATAAVVDSGFYDVVVADATGSITSRPCRLIVAPSEGYPDTLRLDTSFAPRLEAEGATVSALVVAPDGSVYVSGYFTTIADQPRSGLVRFKPDLTLDPDFVSAVETVREFVLQSDGKLLVNRGDVVVRLNTDGSLDPSFTVSFSRFRGVALIEGIALQSDGRLLVRGSFDSVNGVARSRVARLGPNGALDQSFSVSLDQRDTMNAIKALGNRAVLHGTFYRTDGTSYNQLRLLSSDGAVAAATPETSMVRYSRALLESGPDGKIYAVQQNYIGGVWSVDTLVRYNEDATIDSTFECSLSSYLPSFALMADGRIAVLIAPAPGNYVVRVLLSDGTLDPSYAITLGDFSGNSPIASDANGRIFVAGYSGNAGSELNGGLASFGPVGEPTHSLQPGLRSHAYASVALPAGGGKWLISGAFTHLNGVACSGWARLNPDGTTDPSFATTCPPLNSTSMMVMQGDGKILAVGCSPFSVRRLLPDGGDDPSFSFATGTGFNSAPSLAQALPDGRIAVAGNLYGYDGESVFTGCLVLLPDGRRDISFQLATGGSYGARALKSDANGRVVLGGGGMRKQDNAYVGGLIRLNEVGAIVYPVDSVQGPDSVYAIESDVSGKLVLAGNFQQWGPPARHGFVRMNDDGSPVPAGVGAVYINERWPSLAMQGDDKVLVSGGFSSINGIPCGCLIRVKADDSLDTDFCTLDVTSTSTSPIFYADDGRVLLTNATARRDGQSVGPLVMLKPDTLPPAAPIIITQPADGSVAVGGSAHLAVVVTGIAPFSYQWYEGASGDTSHPVSGATLPTFDTPALSLPLQLWVRVAAFSAYTDSRTVSVAIDDFGQSFAQWIAISGVPEGQRGALDTPAGDGVCNLLKFALGVMPFDGAETHLPTPVLFAAEGQFKALALEFSKAVNAKGIRYALEVSPDLTTWTEVESTADDLGLNPDGTLRVRVREAVPADGVSRRFARLRVVLTAL